MEVVLYYTALTWAFINVVAGFLNTAVSESKSKRWIIVFVIPFTLVQLYVLWNLNYLSDFIGG